MNQSFRVETFDYERSLLEAIGVLKSNEPVTDEQILELCEKHLTEEQMMAIRDRRYPNICDLLSRITRVRQDALPESERGLEHNAGDEYTRITTIKLGRYYNVHLVEGDLWFNISATCIAFGGVNRRGKTFTSFFNKDTKVAPTTEIQTYPPGIPLHLLIPEESSITLDSRTVPIPIEYPFWFLCTVDDLKLEIINTRLCHSEGQAKCAFIGSFAKVRLLVSVNSREQIELVWVTPDIYDPESLKCTREQREVWSQVHWHVQRHFWKFLQDPTHRGSKATRGDLAASVPPKEFIGLRIQA